MAPRNDNNNPPAERLDERDNQETPESTGEDLQFNDAEDSFELDAESENNPYQHPLPYETAAPQGADNNSTYDEENIYTPSEYRDKLKEAERELDDLDEEIKDGSLQLDEVDEVLTQIRDDQPEGIDEEGYPTKDDTGGENNPITEDGLGQRR
ncbi:hypothetical protein [Sphingobacterium pedocola]|uniref:Uncharacterized protein n=1 Tax=Sphingobacterium pedocola TaxID=2082722 RepID=A0ABR9TBL6_9SPHI|nr:hypothetical protein [Sphingobacterium pedocola]MBE8722464.1 hypothetical protein [Sphingobacterium pedocola]